MSMFCLQLAGLEGSIPGLARQAGSLRRHNEEQGAKQVEAVMLSARVMTVLSIGEGALHALHVPPTALQLISALLLIVRGIVITGFLMALAKVESRAPRILSREAHTREQQAQQDEQARSQQQMDELAASCTQQIQRLSQQLAQIESTFQQQLAESAATVESTVQIQVATELVAVQENLHRHLAKSLQPLATALAEVQAVQTHLQQRESDLAQQVQRWHAEAPKQSQEWSEPEKRVMLHAVPRRERSTQRDKFDARAFVFSCLQENPDAKLADLAKRALATCNVELSQSTMSRYRKQYFARNASTEEGFSMQGATAE
jgi:hypothetical protein